MTGLRDRLQGKAGRWADLAPRLGSGLAILVLGVLLLLAPPHLAAMGISVLYGALIWELLRLTAPSAKTGDLPAPAPPVAGAQGALLTAAAAAISMELWLLMGGVFGLLPFAALGLGLMWAAPRFRLAYLGQGVMTTLGAAGLGWIMGHQGLATALWIVAVVVLSDVLGYFVGRIMGGPKFWPAVSPKKTWSGTAAGWIGAAALGVVLALSGRAGLGAIVIGPLLAFGGQMGDIAESWIKRRAGVKDSSTIIPGHGGLMDRFDAMGGALAMAFLLALGGLLPVVG